MGKIMIRFLITIISVFFIGCASSKDLETLRLKLYEIQYTQAEQKKYLLQELQNLKKEIDEKLSSSSFKVRAGQADLATKVESLKVKVAKLEGDTDFLLKEIQDQQNSTQALQEKIEVVSNEIKSLRQDILVLKKVLGISDKPEKAHEKEKKMDESSAEKVKEYEKEKENNTDIGQDVQISPERLYEQGLNNFRQKNYYAAAHLFSLFIDKYPKHKLISNAYYWRGECFFNLEQYAKAILNYQQVLDNHKTSNKYPACLLKEGIAFYKLGKKKAGKILLEDLIKNFPKSKEAQYAEKFLKNN